MTVTINLTTIFAWIGVIICAAITLWLLGWLVRGVIGMGEFLGIWPAIALKFQDLRSWMRKKFGKREP